MILADDAAAEKIAGNEIPVALSTHVPSLPYVFIETVLAEAALTGVLKPTTLHTTAMFVAAVAVVNAIVRLGLM